mgnify:FL=1
MSNKTSDENVAKIEDDIKVLNKFCEYEEAVVLTDNALEEVQDAIQHILAEREQMLKEKQDDKKDIIDFQNALNEENLRCANYAIENNELKKRIQELEEQVKTLDEAYTGTIKESKKWFDIAHNSIPTQVVIDKMEELNKEIKSCDEIDAIFKIKQQQILQELLETK